MVSGLNGVNGRLISGVSSQAGDRDESQILCAGIVGDMNERMHVSGGLPFIFQLKTIDKEAAVATPAFEDRCRLFFYLFIDRTFRALVLEVPVDWRKFQ